MMSDKSTEAPLLARARAAMPGRAEIEAALSEIEAALNQINRDGQPEWAAVDDAVADVLAGQSINPDDLGSRVLATRSANEATGAHAEALTRLRERLHVHQRETQVRHADRALGVVATELHQLLTQARPVLAALGNIDSADAAIKAALVDEWQTAGDLGSRYADLRAAQLRITEDALNPGNLADRDVALLVLDHGYVREADRHDDAVGTDPRQPVDHPQLMLTAAGAPAIAATRPWSTGGGLADLHFACRRGVQPWVPSIAELTGARAELKARRRETERAAAGLPAEGTSMFQTTAYAARSTHSVRPMPGDDARRSARLRAPATDAGRVT